MPLISDPAFRKKLSARKGGGNYRKGRRREWAAIKLLERAGYRAYRTAGSHGEWDVIAIGSADVRLVQSKCNAPPLPAEREGMELYPCPANCSREYWVWRDGSSVPAIYRWEGGRWARVT